VRTGRLRVIVLSNKSYIPASFVVNSEAKSKCKKGIFDGDLLRRGGTMR